MSKKQEARSTSTGNFHTREKSPLEAPICVFCHPGEVARMKMAPPCITSSIELMTRHNGNLDLNTSIHVLISVERWTLDVQHGLHFCFPCLLLSCKLRLRVAFRRDILRVAVSCDDDTRNRFIIVWRIWPYRTPRRGRNTLSAIDRRADYTVRLSCVDVII